MLAQALAIGKEGKGREREADRLARLLLARRSVLLGSPLAVYPSSPAESPNTFGSCTVIGPPAPLAASVRVCACATAKAVMCD